MMNIIMQDKYRDEIRNSMKPYTFTDVFVFLQKHLLIFCLAFRYQSGKKFVYLPLLFIDELSNRVKDLVVGDSLIPT